MMPTKQTKIPTIGNTIHNVLLVPAASNAHSGWLAASIAAQTHRAGIATTTRKTSARTITMPAVSHSPTPFTEAASRRGGRRYTHSRREHVYRYPAASHPPWSLTQIAEL